MKRAVNFLVFVLLTTSSCPLNAYDQATHREIAQRATVPTISSLDQILKGELGLSEGIRETFPGISEPGLRSLQQLIGDGAFFEDVPGRRSLNHFHNPLVSPWDDAGLRTFSILGVPLIRGQSLVLWQQNPSQDSTFVLTPVPLLSGGGNWSWQDARRHYLNALTRTRKEDIEREDGQKEPGRDSAFAETFEALGRLTHLLQDATVPAHVRNDPHAEFSIFGVDIPLISNPDGYERHVSRLRGGARNSPARNLFESLVNQPPKRPSFSIFASTGNLQAPVPVARLIDTDLFGGLNSEVLTNTDLGIAEYTNGNFLSDDTIFSNFTLPRRAGLGADFFDPENGKLRRYFEKAFEGESIRHFVAESALYEPVNAELGRPMDEALTLTRRIYEDYAEKLLPRAVGYSAGLLDYFFRGKLDVDLIPDPDSTDPTVVKLSGTNGSPDKLDGGTLRLYAEDPPTGLRDLVPAFDPNPNFTVVADPGQSLESAKFQINAEAERFMAVYKGKLGEEKPEGDFPGGVIGKVLGGVRAESIFPDGDKRKLRTVPVDGVGVFPLPPTADRLQKIQWGDLDNTFVGTLSTSANPNSPDQILAFKIDRDPGSPVVPLVDGPGGTRVVSASVTKTIQFPFGLPLGVTVNYSQSVQFRQFLFVYRRFITKVLEGLVYRTQDEQVIGPSQADADQPAINESVSFSQNFSILLDQAHHRFGGSVFRPYVWSVEDVAIDRQGRVLALVNVSLTNPDNNTRTIKLKRLNPQCTELVEDSFLSQSIRASFPDGEIWALIDVEKPEVLGVTSSPAFAPSEQSATSRLLIQDHTVETRINSPTEMTVTESCGIPQQFVFPNPNLPTPEPATIRAGLEGILSEGLAGRFRDDLKPLVSTDTTLATTEFERVLVYFVDSFNQVNRTIRLITPISRITSPVTAVPFSPLVQIMRPTTEGSPELILLFQQTALQGEITKDLQPIIVRWSPEAESRTQRAIAASLPASGFHLFKFATPQSALVEFEDLDLGALTAALMDFSAGTIQFFPGKFLTRDYVLLDPKFLYNLNDTRFHTLDPSLQASVLPRQLADAPVIRPPSAAYHLIRLR